MVACAHTTRHSGAQVVAVKESATPPRRNELNFNQKTESALNQNNINYTTYIHICNNKSAQLAGVCYLYSSFLCKSLRMEAYVPWQPQLTWLNKHKSIAMNFRTGPPPSSLHRQTTKCFCFCCCSCSHYCFYTSCCCCSLCCCYRNCYGCGLCCCCCLTSVLVWWALLYLKLTGGAAPSKQMESHMRTVWQSH